VAIEATHAYVISLIRALDKFQQVTVDPDKIELTFSAGDDYAYDITSKAGRTWSQVLRIPTGSEAAMTFDVPSFWKLSEFSEQRPIRDLLINLVREFGLTDAKIKWPDPV
jgi:hypothetical protein